MERKLPFRGPFFFKPVKCEVSTGFLSGIWFRSLSTCSLRAMFFQRPGAFWLVKISTFEMVTRNHLHRDQDQILKVNKVRMKWCTSHTRTWSKLPVCEDTYPAGTHVVLLWLASSVKLLINVTRTRLCWKTIITSTILTEHHLLYEKTRVIPARIYLVNTLSKWLVPPTLDIQIH